MSYKRSMLAHAEAQLRDRFGVSATRRDIEDLSYAVSAGYARLLKKQEARGREVYEVMFRGEYYTIAYDVAHQVVVTFIPDNDQRWVKLITPRRRRKNGNARRTADDVHPDGSSGPSDVGGLEGT